MKQVRETAAGKSISAYAILKNGIQVATVQAHYSNSGVVQVDVWNGHKLTQARANGGGYDKFGAALGGMVIDGVELYDGGGNEATEAILALYHSGSIDADQARQQLSCIGAHLANYIDGKWQSAHYTTGLDRLKQLGYQVIQAI